MDRRSFLRHSLTASIAIGAGCVSSNSTDLPDNNSSSPENSTDRSNSDGGKKALEVVENELIHTGSGETAEVKVCAVVENVSPNALGQVVASATFIEDGALLSSWVVTANGMDPGQRWEFDIRSGGATGEDAQAVDDVQLDVEERVSVADYGSDRIEIVENELVRDENNIIVEGVAKNAGDERLEYATIVATFVDTDDVLVGRALTHTVRDVDPDQRFKFSIRYSARVRDPADIDDYQLTAHHRVEK
ncbi:FxLYD domain-containing protein [Natrinema hispanicum]|uniref:Uncharacterized protein n=1 Tax=Natrinema hispanicum TaxID=392421 RepID=A0A1I0IWK8_9EURY|nr:FxLYD domain-containing protein [Natrinema hispanicum]SEU01011.1 hypothetical protein SAMN04488694_12626 [Natrinema hispanicum]